MTASHSNANSECHLFQSSTSPLAHPRNAQNSLLQASLPAYLRRLSPEGHRMTDSASRRRSLQETLNHALNIAEKVQSTVAQDEQNEGR